MAAQVNAFQERLEKATIFLLQSLGEDLAKYAKDHHNYQDQTLSAMRWLGKAR